MTHTSSCYRHIGLPTSNCCCVMVSSNVIQTTATLFALLPTICNFICTLGSDAKFFSENPKYTFISKYRLYRAWSELHWAYNSRKNWLWKNSPKWPNSGQKVKVSPLCTSMKRVPLCVSQPTPPDMVLNHHPQTRQSTKLYIFCLFYFLSSIFSKTYFKILFNNDSIKLLYFFYTKRTETWTSAAKTYHVCTCTYWDHEF